MAHKDSKAASTNGSHAVADDWRSFFTNPQWVLFGVLIVLGLILRWTLLDMKPYHHDESLHGMYGRYFYDFPENNYYKYDPMLHGPMLYNTMRLIYAMFGDSVWAARTPVCIMGSIFMFMPLLFRRYFTPTIVLILTAAVCLSPTMIYWARFLREDSWVIAGMLVTLYGFTLASDPWKAFFVLLGFTLQWCTKESTIVSLAVVFGYIVFESFMNSIVLKTNKPTTAGRILKYIGNHPWETAWAVIISLLVYTWFFTAGFRHPNGFVDGLIKGYEYWSEHHKMERIKGPFNFHVYVMAWYELPVFIAFLAHIVLFYRRASSEIRFAGFTVVAAIALACFYTNERTIQENSLWKIFKLKDNLDIVGLLVLLFHSPIVTIQHLIRRESALAVTGYFGTSMFFVYSFLGEKVPWLSVYPLVFMMPYLALFFHDYFKNNPVNYKNYPVQRALLITGLLFCTLSLIFIAERLPADPKTNEDYVLLGFGVLLIAIGLLDSVGNYLGTFNVGRWLTVGAFIFTFRAAIQTNFLYAGKETEYLSQVHSTYDVQEIANQIIDDVQNQRSGYKPLVLYSGEATWPLAWYFRNLGDACKFTSKKEERVNYTYMFIDWKDEREPGDIPEGYTVRKMNLRGWWVPDFRIMTLKKFLRYSINHYPWSPSGFTYTTFLMAKDTTRFKK